MVGFTLTKPAVTILSFEEMLFSIKAMRWRC